MEISESQVPDFNTASDNSFEEPVDFTSAAEEDTFVELPPILPLSTYDIPDDYIIPSELLAEYEKTNPVT